MIILLLIILDSLEVAVELLQKPNAVKNSKRNKSANIHRSKSRETIPHPLPDPAPPSDSSSSSENEERSNQNEIFINQQEISFQNDLQEYGDSLTPQERKKGRRRAKPPKSSKPKPRDPPPTANKKENKEKNEIFKVIQEGDLKSLELCLEKLQNKLSNNTVNDDVEEISKKTVDVINDVLDENSNTLLHLAAIYQQLHIIDYLLNHNADPCKKNSKQQTPYTCTQNKGIREIFKEFAQTFPEKYNYNKVSSFLKLKRKFIKFYFRLKYPPPL